VIYLGQEDIHQAAGIVEWLDAIEAALRLYEAGDFQMPERLHVEKENDVLLLMPCFTKEAFATKLVTLFPGNAERGVPVLTGLVVLNDIETGAPVALLDGATLTAMRTAAVASVGIRHLAPEGVRSLGLIGAGAQGYYQAWLACASKGFADLYIFDQRSEQAQTLVEQLAGVLPQTRIHQAPSVEELLVESEVVITATTASEPVLPEKRDLLEGRHFVAIGSYQPHVRELPETLFGLLDAVLIDTEHALAESGDLIVPLRKRWIEADQVMTISRFLCGQRRPQAATTLFKSVGMALFDVCAAKFVCDKAVEKGLGQQIKT